MSSTYFKIIDQDLINRVYHYQEAVWQSYDDEAVDLLVSIISDYKLLPETSNTAELQKKAQLLSKEIKVEVDEMVASTFIYVPMGKSDFDPRSELRRGFSQLSNFGLVETIAKQKPLALPPARQKLVDQKKPVLGNIQTFYANGSDVDMIEAIKILAIPQLEEPDVNRPYILGDFLANTSIFKKHTDRDVLYKTAEYLDRDVCNFDIIPSTLHNQPINYYPFSTDMTALAYKGIKERNMDMYKLYRSMAWGFKNPEFCEKFVDGNDQKIKAVKHDTKIEGVPYFFFHDDRDRIKSAKLYAFTKEAWFLAQNRHVLDDKNALQAKTVFNQANRFYKDLGLFNKGDNIDMLEFSKCIHLCTDINRTDTSFTLDPLSTSDPETIFAVSRALKSPVFTKQVFIS